MGVLAKFLHLHETWTESNWPSDVAFAHPLRLQTAHLFVSTLLILARVLFGLGQIHQFQSTDAARIPIGE